MKNRLAPIIALLGGVLFAILFHHQRVGVNLLLFESLLLSAGIFFQTKPRKPLFWLLTALTLLSAVFVVWHNTILSKTTNFICLFLTTGAFAAPQLRSIYNVLQQSFLGLFQSQINFFKQFKIKAPSGNLRPSWRLIINASIPVAAVIVFFFLYRWANPKFNEWIAHIEEYVGIYWGRFIEMFDWAGFGLFILGCILCNALLLSKAYSYILKRSADKKDNLTRQMIKEKHNRRFRIFKKMGLKHEHQIAFLTFLSLNCLLLAFLFVEVQTVWFNFEYDGLYLRKFVHQGSYVLLFTIVVSVLLTLVFFRGNLHYYRDHNKVKLLATLWILLNTVLLFSTLVRLYRYVTHFGLAYGRVALLFCLILAVVGLVLVVVKLWKNKSNYFLVRTGGIAAITILVFINAINWDSEIAKYNFKNAEKNFVHFRFLKNLGSCALPYMELPLAELEQMEQKQTKKFLFRRNKRYMQADHFKNAIDYRIEQFVADYPKRHWLSWNYADAIAYKKLK